MEKCISIKDSIRLQLRDDMDESLIKSIYGTSSPDEIDKLINEFCIRYLESKIEGCSFYYTSVGSTFIVRLENGKNAVIKADRKDKKINELYSACDIQNKLALEGFPCPKVIIFPMEYNNCLIHAMECMDQGEKIDGHDPSIRKQMASTLARLIDKTKKYNALIKHLPVKANSLWPKPHNVLFDFSRESSLTRIIDDIGGHAKAILQNSNEASVIGHSDWSIQNVAFKKGSLAAVFDWDSLRYGSEMYFAGASSHTFPYDWREDEEPIPTSIAEVKSYITEYEEARCKPFTDKELNVVHASIIYSMGYSTRCKVSLYPHRVDAVDRLIDFSKEFLGIHY